MREKFSCIIIDDEQLAIDHLAHFLQEMYPFIEVVATFTSWTKAMQGLGEISADILFLDISMQGRNGMDLLRVHPNLRSEVVFVTAHAEYALDAFRLAASAYLLKPFDTAELTKTVNRILARISDKRKAAAQTESETQPKIKKLAVPNSSVVSYIDVDKIFFLEGVDGYTRIVYESGDLLSSYRLGEFYDQIKPLGFYQVHRSFIVNLNHVKSYENTGTLILANGFQVPVAKTYREVVLSMFLKIR